VQAKQGPLLVILGAGGHGRVVADAALASGKWAAVVATDRDPSRCHGELLPGVPCLPLAEATARPHGRIHVAIGKPADRERECAPFLDRLGTVVHPSASVSPQAQVGAGSFVAAHAVVAPGATLAVAVIVNHGAVADHDAQVGAFAHLAPRAAVGGGCGIGAHVLLGSGACVLPGVRITGGCVIGAGAVVHRDVTECGVYAGVPVRRLR
jgi:sugar O-acyltransferase (sialic acid O-acetyltransferase NeuD family)